MSPFAHQAGAGGFDWVWVVSGDGEQYQLDANQRQAVFAAIADFEARLYDAGGDIAHFFEERRAQQQFLNINQLIQRPAWFVGVNEIMRPVMAHIHDVCRATPGLREGKLLIFKPDDVAELEFEQYFAELAASLQAGPLGMLVDQQGQPAVTGVKCSGMGGVLVEDDPCIAVLFENCWDVEIGRLVTCTTFVYALSTQQIYSEEALPRPVSRPHEAWPRPESLQIRAYGYDRAST
ncbi:hypothetical protein V8E36_003574 [Tilletia maclaganii]